MNFSIIAAMGKNREIGINGQLPWYIEEDMKFFRNITRGHTVIMGSKTYESIYRSLGGPLPNRTNIVISRNPQYLAPGCRIVNSIEAALSLSKDDNEIFVIGGAQIYEAAMPFVNKIYLTEIDAEFTADAYFPDIELSEWNLVQTQVGKPKEREPQYSFLTYERNMPPIDLSLLQI